MHHRNEGLWVYKSGSESSTCLIPCDKMKLCTCMCGLPCVQCYCCTNRFVVFYSDWPSFTIVFLFDITICLLCECTVWHTCFEYSQELRFEDYQNNRKGPTQGGGVGGGSGGLFSTTSQTGGLGLGVGAGGGAGGGGLFSQTGQGLSECLTICDRI